MHKGEEHKLTSDIQAADVHYFSLVNIIEQAKKLGLKLDELLTPEQQLSGNMPIAMLGELIQKARRKLYLQMMEFEMLDMELAELHTELSELPKEPTKPAVRLSLV